MARPPKGMRERRPARSPRRRRPSCFRAVQADAHDRKRWNGNCSWPGGASIDRDVAIKILNPDKAGDKEARDRFRVEAAAVSRLKSPHTVTVFDFGEDEQGNMFLAMEFLEGRPLSTYLKERGPIEPRLVEIADQV